MPIDNSALAKAFQQFGSQFERFENVHYATYVSDNGDGTHIVDVLNPDGSQGVRRDVIGKGGWWAGVIVRIGVDRMRWGPTEYVILGIDETAYSVSGTPAPSMLEKHGPTHGDYGTDQIPNLHTLQIWMLRVQPSAGLTVDVLPGLYFANNVYNYLPALVNVDLTASVPGAGLARYATISINGAGGITTTNGATQVAPQASDIALPPVGDRPLCAVLLTNGMTTITQTEVRADLRYLAGGVNSGGSGGTIWENVVIVAKGGGDTTTVQGGENMAVADDAVVVMPGDYAENVTWDVDGPLYGGFGAEVGVNSVITGWNDVGPMVDWNVGRVIKGLFFERTLAGGAGEYICLDMAEAAVSPNLSYSHINIDDGATGRNLTAVELSTTADSHIIQTRIYLSGAGTLNALKITTGGTVYLEDCIIEGDILLTGSATVIMKNCYIIGDVTGIAGSDLFIFGGDYEGTISGWDNVSGYYYDDSGGIVHIQADMLMHGTLDMDNQGLLNVYQQVVTVAKAGGDFTTIQGAINSILDATTNKRYAVYVQPGNYAETVTMKDYVDIIGTGRTNSRITGTTGTVLIFPANKGTILDMGIYVDYGALGANSQAITSAGADSVMIRCDIGVTKSGGDFVMNALNITAGAFRMSDCYFTYSITGATAATGLTQSAVVQTGVLTTVILNNNEMTIISDDTNDDLVGFETTANVTGIALLANNVIDVDCGAAGNSATGLWLYGTGSSMIASQNRLTVNCNASAYGLWVDSTAGGAVIDTRHNEIIATAVGAAISGHVEPGDTWNSAFDKITAATGYSGTGTITFVSSPIDGHFATTDGIDIQAPTTTRPVAILQTTDDNATNPILEIQSSAGAMLSEIEKDGNLNFATATAANPGMIEINDVRFTHTYGTNNMFLGLGSGNFTLTGTQNTAIGRSALVALTSGLGNVAIGDLALIANTSGNQSIAIGAEALEANTIGGLNVAIGYQAMTANISGNYCIGIGHLALRSNTTGDANVGIGYRPLDANNTGFFNIAIGRETLFLNTTGAYNTAIGYQALYNNISADGNVAIGDSTLYDNTTGASNVAIGRNALTNNTSANFNIAIGTNASLSGTTGASNTAIGTSALLNNLTGSFNIGIGTNALRENTGSSNVGIGTGAMRYQTSGLRNVAIGTNAGLYNQTGDYNVRIGYGAGQGVTGNSHSNNVFVGYQAGFAITTGGNNVCIGFQAGNVLTTGGDNIIIGHDVDPTGAAVSDELNIGDLLYGDMNANTAGVNVTPPNLLATWHVDQLSTTAAIPVLYLDQADISEEMIEFNTTIGVGNAIEAVGAKVLTTTHFIKVTLPGGLTRYIPCGTIA